MTFSDIISANIGSYITQFGNTGNAQVLDTVVGSAKVFVRFISGAFSLGVGSGNIRVNGANVGVFPLTSVSTANVVPVLYNTGTFSNSTAGWISINGANAGVRLSTTTDIPNTIVLQANVGDTITQIGSAATATVTANIVDAINIPVEFTGGIFTLNSGNLKINGSNVAVYPLSTVATPILQAITANVGDYITQPSTGANAQVTKTVYNALTVPVVFLANNFTTGSTAGNLRVNGANIKSFPANVICTTDITCDYNTVNTFNLNVSDASALVKINGNSTNSYISSVTSVGVTLGLLATEGTIGFDEAKFDQGTLELPAGLSINTTTGWITGQLPLQTINEQTYEFEVTAYKRDDASYNDKQLYTLTVLGDLNNRIDWITPSDLGTIQNGKVSDLFVRALSTKGKTLVYKLTGGEYLNLPQGLSLTSNGLLSGRVSFQLFSLDQGTTYFDPNSLDQETTSFDQTYSFTITASDIDGTISADQTFSIRVINANIKPYENLYLKALPTQEQRQQFSDIIQDRTIFPQELVYRNEDPFFGLAKNIKTLFLPGLNPTELADYTAAASTNHFNKRITFSGIKTAQALDTNFNVKYEVVYLEIRDENTNALGQGPADTQFPLIDNPYYDLDGNTYTVAYPNAFSNMKDVMVDNLDYANKGALPDWMTSKQTNGRVLGFTRAVVLGYVVPGAANKIAYRLGQRQFNFNEIDFTVDRYQVDNNLTANYDIAANAFITSTETTFDRYPATTTAFTEVGSVNYAVSIPFDEINNHVLTEIQDLGGLDGVRNFQDGDTLIFATQEFRQAQVDISDYNQGWSNIQSLWDSVSWDYDVDTTDNPYTEEYGYYVTPWGANTNITAGQTILNSGTHYRAEFDFTSGSSFATTAVVGGSTVTVLTALPTPVFPYDSLGVGWDEAGYIPGYTEYNLGTRYPPTTLGFPDNPIDAQLAYYNGKTYSFNVDSNQWELANQRIGVWRINIDSEDIVTLTFIQSVKLYDQLFVRNGQTYGATNIYYDPVVKEGNTLANYSIIPQQVLTVSTVFDGNGTRFFDYRDQYTLPEAGDKYIKFTKYGVFT
jgi:hypothetical protein